MKIPREPEKPKSNQIGETTKAVAQTHPSPTQEIAPTATSPPRPAAVPLSEPPWNMPAAVAGVGICPEIFPFLAYSRSSCYQCLVETANLERAAQPREGDLLGLSVQCLNGIWREFTGEPFVEHCI
jgi:hypothetical protein